MESCCGGMLSHDLAPKQNCHMIRHLAKQQCLMIKFGPKEHLNIKILNLDRKPERKGVGGGRKVPLITLQVKQV